MAKSGNKFIRLIEQSIKFFQLDLTGLNILIPTSIKEPSLTLLLAGMAGAKNIYVKSNEFNAVEKTYITDDLNIKSNISFITEETPQLLSSLDVVIKGGNISDIDFAFVSDLKENSVISILPDKLDFYNIDGIDLEACANKKIPVVAVNPNDPNLMLNRYFTHIILKRCYDAGIELFRSRILLIGNGELLENTLKILKLNGATVYAAYTNKPQIENYISKYLSSVDAVVAVDYPQSGELIIGANGIIKIADLVELNPDVEFIHFSGNVEGNTIKFAGISTTPEEIVKDKINVNPEEFSLRLIIDTTAASMKIAESLIKSTNRTILPNESIVSYDIINADGPIVLGKIMF